MIPAAHSSLQCSINDSQHFFMPYWPLYTSSLLSRLLNDNIVDTKKPNEVCLLTFYVDGISRLFLHPWIFSTKHSGCAKIKSAKTNIIIFLEGNIKIFTFTYFFMKFMFLFCWKRIAIIKIDIIKITTMFRRCSSKQCW